MATSIYSRTREYWRLRRGGNPFMTDNAEWNRTKPPTNGKREVARRARQIAAGQLRVG